MTSTISWNLIASYYESLPFGRDGLMTAEEPWSGHYVVDNPVWITAHTTQFTEIGWSYLRHGHGVGLLDNGGSYVALSSPDKKQLTIIIETMSHNHSVCIRPDLPKYNVSAQQAEFILAGSFASIPKLQVWKTQLSYDGLPDSTVFVKQPSITPYQGMYVMTFEPDQIYTLTTMTSGLKGVYPQPPAPAPFPFPYSDNFDTYAEYSEAYNFAPQSGVWEVRQSNDPAHGKVNRQVVLNDPIYWCSTHPATLNVGGDPKWMDVFIVLDVFVPSLNGSAGVYVGGRVDRGGCDSASARGIFFIVFTTNNTFYLTTDLQMRNILSNGTVSVKNDTWYTMTLVIKKDMTVGLLDQMLLFESTVPPLISSSGFAAYGTPVLGLADFDNLSVQSPDHSDLHYYRSYQQNNNNIYNNKKSFSNGRYKNSKILYQNNMQHL